MQRNQDENSGNSLQDFLDEATESIDFGQRAHHELNSVHRRELAGLLIDAARLHLRLGNSGRTSSEYGTLLEPVSAGWEKRARLELELLERDGCDLEGQDLLLMQLESEEKPLPELLILMALNLWSSPSGYLALGQVLLARGDARRARDIYAELLRQDIDGDLDEGADFPWRLREGLAAAWEGLGSDRLALGCLRKAIEARGAGAGPLVAGFFLALECGRGGEALQFAEQLDSRFSLGSLRLRACIRSLGKRVQRRQKDRSGGCWTPPKSAVAAFEQLLQGTGSAAEMCKELVGKDGAFAGLAS